MPTGTHRSVCTFLKAWVMFPLQSGTSGKRTSWKLHRDHGRWVGLVGCQLSGTWVWEILCRTPNWCSCVLFRSCTKNVSSETLCMRPLLNSPFAACSSAPLLHLVGMASFAGLMCLRVGDGRDSAIAAVTLYISDVLTFPTKSLALYVGACRGPLSAFLHCLARIIITLP